MTKDPTKYKEQAETLKEIFNSEAGTDYEKLYIAQTYILGWMDTDGAKRIINAWKEREEK